jgi:hypothetical protein
MKSAISLFVLTWITTLAGIPMSQPVDPVDATQAF